jgi:hypothetical protein
MNENITIERNRHLQQPPHKKSTAATCSHTTIFAALLPPRCAISRGGWNNALTHSREAEKEKNKNKKNSIWPQDASFEEWLCEGGKGLGASKNVSHPQDRCHSPSPIRTKNFPPSLALELLPQRRM